MNIKYENYDNAINAFNASTPPKVLSKRILQSIAFHFHLNVDLSKYNIDELKYQIGYCILNEHSHPTKDGSSRTYVLSQDSKDIIEKICFQDCVDEFNFDFLNAYSSKSIASKIEGLGIATNSSIRFAFNRNQSSSVTLGYLCDKSELNALTIIGHLNTLRNNINEMKLRWGNRIDWFNNFQKISAANYYSGKQISSSTALLDEITYARHSMLAFMPSVKDINDIEIFFNNYKIPDIHKEFVFKKIRDLYNMRTSRASSKKLQSNFALSPEAKLLIEIMAKNNGITKPSVIEAIFRKGNKEILQNLINQTVRGSGNSHS